MKKKKHANIYYLSETKMDAGLNFTIMLQACKDEALLVSCPQNNIHKTIRAEKHFCSKLSGEDWFSWCRQCGVS